MRKKVFTRSNLLTGFWTLGLVAVVVFICACKARCESVDESMATENVQEDSPIFLWGEEKVYLQLADTLTEAMDSKSTYEMSHSGESVVFWYGANKLEEEAVVSLYHVSEKGETIQEKPYLVKKDYELSIPLEKGVYCVCVNSNEKERYCIFRMK